MYYPLNYDKLNMRENTFIPSMIKNRNNLTYSFWERSLFQRACSTIILNVPESWSGNVKDFLYYALFRRGYVAVFSRDEFGTVFSPCTLNGFDFYYQPTNCIIANPRLKESLDLRLGEECELIKLTPDYMGIWDIISYYAEKLSILDTAINTSIINNKFAYIVGAKNKAAAETLKQLMDKINQGDPAVFYDNKISNDPNDRETPFQFLERSGLKANYITTEQLMDWQTLISNFDAEIGIPALPYNKRERLVTDEATSRIMDSTSRSIIWYSTLTDSIGRVNRMFPELNLSCELRYKPEESEGDYEQNEDNDNRTI